MKRLVFIGSLFFLSACGSDNAPTAPTPAPPAQISVPQPIAAAVLVQTGQLTLPGCDALLQLAASVGLNTATCKQFTGFLSNTGNGCAANVRGTTAIFTDAAGTNQISAGGWAYDNLVRAGEQIAYTGGILSIPTRQWYWRTTSSWDSVRCS